jgi:hypothetical protein
MKKQVSAIVQEHHNWCREHMLGTSPVLHRLPIPEASRVAYRERLAEFDRKWNEYVTT